MNTIKVSFTIYDLYICCADDVISVFTSFSTQETRVFILISAYFTISA